MSFDQVPTENSTNMVNSGTVYSALDLKADKSTIYTKTEVDTALSAKADQSTTYTKTEVDTALSNVQSTLTFDNVPTANSDNPVKSSGIKTALDSKQDTLTFDSTPTANSTNPVTSGGVYTALQNVDANIEVDDEITEDSDNPVTSAAIYEALQNFTPSGDVGGAGNASGVVRDLLYENSEGLSSGTITLNKSWKDYDVIEIDYSGQNWSVSLPVYHNVNKIKSEGYISAYTDETSDSIKFFDLKVVSGSDTQLTVDGSRFFVCRKIYGIKFSKNLSEQMYSNVLYENSSGANTGNIILSDSYKNYDFIGFNFSLQAESPASNSPIQNSSIVSVQQLEDSKVGKFSIHGFDNRSTHFIIVNDTTFNCTLTENGQKISKIYGIKLAKGGYSGIVSDARMTVKSGTVTLGNNLSANSDYKYNITFDSPMPDANYIIQLSGSNQSAYWANINYTTKDKTVNGFTVVVWATHAINESHTLDWIAIRPNSYTREGMVEDVLFSNASGVNSGTINLSGNISDYDLICFVYNTNGGSSNLFKQHYYINPSNLSVGDKVSLTGYDNRYIDVQLVSDQSLSITGRNEHTLIKIIGIKFGRYVSGVAVDTTVTQNSDAVVTSGAVYDALQNYTPSGGGSGSITVDTTITENSQNPVTSAAIYAALQGAGGGGGSIVVDAVPTQNSTNAVQSGGVYDALQNISGGFEIFEIDDTKLTPVPNFTCDSKYYRDTKDTVLCTNWPYNEEAYLKNSIPCVFGQLRDDGCKVIVVSPIKEGTEMYFKLKNGNSVDYIRTTTGTVTTSGGDLLYYTFTTDKVFGGSYSHNIYPDVSISGDWNSGSNSAQALITVSQLTITEDLSYNVDSTYIQEIQDQIVVKFNGELYYRCKETPVSNHIYFYSLDKKSQMEVKMLDFNFNASIMTIKENVPIRSSLELDTTPTENSTNAITSGAVYTALQNAGGGSSITVDSTITQGGTNPVEGGAIYTALDDKADKSDTYTKTEIDTALGSKQGTLTFDTTPTADSSNPITSGGVYTAFQNIGENIDVDVFTLKTHASNLTLQDDGAYYVATANKVVGEWSYNYVSGDTVEVRIGNQVVKCNNIPALCGTASIKTGSGYASGTIVAPILISLIPDGVNWNKVNGSTGTVESSNNGYIGYYDDTQRGVRWYYSTVWWYNSSGDFFSSDYPRVGSRTYNTVLEAVQAILDAANPILIETLINEDLFNPSVYVAFSYSGDPVIISNATVKGLIKGCRPFKYYDGTYIETCYYIKQVNGSYTPTYHGSQQSPSTTANVYHYESQSYKFQIKDVTWEMTVTPKTSSGLTAGDGIDITNDTVSLEPASSNSIGGIKVGSGLSIDANGVLSATGGSGAGDVTTNTDQNITGTKTFVGSKKVAFKQSTTNDKLGFTLFGNTGTERGYLEFNPTNTVDGVAGLMTLGNYATSAAALTQVGFRRYSNISGQSGAYNLLMPMVADARTPFSLTTSYQNFYLPLGFTNGTTTVKTAKSGVVDLSPLLASLEARIAALEGN